MKITKYDSGLSTLVPLDDEPSYADLSLENDEGKGKVTMTNENNDASERFIWKEGDIEITRATHTHDEGTHALESHDGTTHSHPKGEPVTHEAPDLATLLKQAVDG